MEPVPQLCLGTRGLKDRVRAIKYSNSIYAFPPYSSDLRWREDSGNIFVYHKDDETEKVTIDKARTIDTYGQCWPTHINSMHLTDKDFFDNVKRLFSQNYDNVRQLFSKNVEFLSQNTSEPNDVREERDYTISVLFTIFVIFVIALLWIMPN